MMITVEVRLYASLRKYHPSLGIGEAIFVPLDDEAKLENMLDGLNIPKDEIAIAMVNGNREEEDCLLRDKDRIGLFPLIGGG
ncbi:MoaD/ThiS family protein [Chloroflexota bacterium]